MHDGHRPRRSLADGLRSLLRRVAVSVVGTALLLVGAAMLVLPGPGVLVVLGGLAVLSREFAWADRLAQRVRWRARTAAAGLRGRRPAGGAVR